MSANATATAPAQEAPPLLRFAGAPLRVQALVPRPADDLTGATLHLQTPDGDLPLPVLALPEGPQLSTVRLLPTEPLPAGSFAGRLVVGGEAWPAEVVVQAKPKARAYPSRLELTPATSGKARESAGGDLELVVDLLNVGNVDLTVGTAYAVPLEAAGALGRAIAAGVTSEDGGVARWGAAADAVAASQAGVARIAVRQGTGPLPPRAAHRVSGVLRLPEGLRPGVPYAGTWQLPGVSVPLVVTLPESR